MKVRTHVLILMLISFGGSCLLGTLAFWTYSHYNNKRKELDDATFQILDEGIFSLAKSFTKSVREYITSLDVNKNSIFDATNDDIALIKETYNRFIQAYSLDTDFRNKLSEIKFNDGSNFASDIEEGVLRDHINMFERSIYNHYNTQINNIKKFDGYKLATRVKKAFGKNDLINSYFIQKAEPIIREKEKYSQTYEQITSQNKDQIQKTTDALNENLENLNYLTDKLDIAIFAIQEDVRSNFDNQKLEFEDDVLIIRWFLIFIAIGYICIVIYIGIATYKTFASPIRKLEIAAKNSIDHQKPFKLKETGPFEIKSLTRRLQGLVIGLEETVKMRTSELLAKTELLQNEIKQRKELETQLVHAQKMEAVGQLASGIAHEINSPSQFANDNILFLKEAITGFIAKIKGEKTAPDDKELQFLSENAPDAVDQASEGIGRITTIVKSMKNFAYKDAKSEKKPSDLNKAIQSTVVVATNEWKYHAELNLELDETLPFVPCNIGEINQVVLNLVVNGAHAIRDYFTDGQKGNLLVTTKHYESAGCVVISITDNGGGIPQKVKDRIFEPFFTTKEVGVGTGQGLAIAHNVITKSHNGQIWFDTEEGRGTTFYIKLPMVQNESK